MVDVSVSEILYKAADLIAAPRAWVQYSSGDGAGCFCAWSAIIKSADGDRKGLEKAVEIADSLTGGIVTWNDELGRKKGEVVAKLREAGDIAGVTA